MAFRPLLQQRVVVPAMAAVAGSGLVFSTPRHLHAEEPVDVPSNRKPIYDNLPLTAPTPVLAPGQYEPPTSPSTPAPTEPYRPTPTDRLAVQIGHARLALHAQAQRAETSIDSALTETLRLEHSFVSTIRSLAPSRETGEKVFPGALYVLVASMAGSIITRNRNILLRASVPAAIGLGAAYAVLPVTMRNVGDLAWTYEERYPAVAEAHLAVRERVQRFVETGVAHGAMTAGMVGDKVGETRRGVEEWIGKGR